MKKLLIEFNKFVKQNKKDMFFILLDVGNSSIKYIMIYKIITKIELKILCTISDYI